MLRSIVVLCVFLVTSIPVYAAPEIVPVSVYPVSQGYVMESPAVDCWYDMGYADLSKSLTGAFALFRKPGQQRISTFRCAVRIDNSKSIEKVSIWGNQTVNNLNNIATCNLDILSNIGSTTSYPMTPVYLISSAAVVQYSVDNLTNVNTSGSYVTGAGIICDAQDGVSMIAVSGLGVKYYP